MVSSGVSTIMKNGLPIVHKTKVLSMSPSRTLMSLEQEIVERHNQGLTSFEVVKMQTLDAGVKLTSKRPADAPMIDSEMPGLVLAGQNLPQSLRQQSIPNRRNQPEVNFELAGDRVLLRDPSLKTNQEKVVS